MNGHDTPIALGTNILDVDVPSQLRVRRSVGIDWLNRALGGTGMTPSSLVMVTGAPGFGKSTLVRQVADSITAQGHVALYNSGEESLYQVRMRTEEMGLTHGFQVGEEAYVGKLLAHARELQALNPKKQVFLMQDSLQSLNDGYYKDGGVTGQTPVRCCEMLRDWAKETYGIAVFIGQVTKDGVFAGKNTIKHLVDVHCELRRDDDKDSPTRGNRLFVVSKNRFGPDGMTFAYALTGKGLVVNDVVANDTGHKRTESGVMLKAVNG